MKKNHILLILYLILLAACGEGDTSSVETAVPEPIDVVAEESPTEPAAEPTAVPTETAVPEPTDTPKPTNTPAPMLITSADEMVGVWQGTLAGETGYVMYTADGRFYVSLAEENLVTSPRVVGEYWFEDGQIHLRDLENVGHWTECSADIEGVYDVLDLGDGAVQFQTVEDACNEGGFTRNYLFANLKQEWQSEPLAVAEETMPELAAALQAIADNWVSENGVPGVILQVDMPDRNYTFAGAAGLANPDMGDALLPDDQFIISSMTKMFTAVTILKLMEQGVVSLDDPLGQYLPAELVSHLLVIDGQSYGEAITVRQLLNHTSGLGDFSNGVDVDGNGISDFKELVLAEPDTIWDETMVLDWAIENTPPLGQPGKLFGYSDTNYQLLGMIIEAASGMALHEAYRQLIFEPLEMTHTYFEFREPVVAGEDGRSVSNAYYNGVLWNELDSHSYEWGSGGLVSTAPDLNNFLWAWVTGALFDDPVSQEAMTTWITTPDCGTSYGMGLYRFVYEECDIAGLGENIGHPGLFNSFAFYWPEQNATLIGTLNSIEPPLGFFGLIIEAMFTVQGFAE
ncbi:MAG: serine hydrolase [Anaerolineales bacterium]|nr:serine hydrolase [Anaerolineales bacterium]